MHSTAEHQLPHQTVEEERAAYLEDLPEPDADWPPEVRAVYETLRDRLFNWGGVTAQEVVDECGIGSHDIYGRFRHCTGRGIREFVVHHRIQLARRLLRYESLSVFTMRPAGASDTIECNPECSWVCDGGAGPCMETQCCTVDQLPCDEDDVESITCKGDPEIVITPEQDLPALLLAK